MPVYRRGEEVQILDYPFGKPLGIRGKVVGILPNDFYNVLLLTGVFEGQIKKYKHWTLFSPTQPTDDLIF